MKYSYTALRRLNASLGDQSSLPARPQTISPVAGFRDFASNLRYSTKIEFPSFTFPSVLRVVFIDSFPLSGND